MNNTIVLILAVILLQACATVPTSAPGYRNVQQCCEEKYESDSHAFDDCVDRAQMGRGECAHARKNATRVRIASNLTPTLISETSDWMLIEIRRDGRVDTVRIEKDRTYWVEF